MTSIRILVISSCTGKKKFKTSEALTLDDFQTLPRLQLKIEKLETQGYQAPTIDLYAGIQRLYVCSAVRL